MKQKQLFILLILFTFLGCDKDDPVEPENLILGNWELSFISLTMGTSKTDYTPETASLWITLTVNKDNTFSMVIKNPSGTTNDGGTWQESSNRLMIKYNDGRNMDFNYKIENGILTLEGYYEFAQGIFVPAVLRFNKK